MMRNPAKHVNFNVPIKQKFITTYLPGATYMSFGEWLTTQSKDEQSRYHQARARMDAYRQEAIDNGRMTIDLYNNYIWRDEQSRQQGKQQDDECLNFYDRYNKDVGMIVTWVWEEI